MAEQNKMPPQMSQQQEAPRMPNLDPQMYALMNELDGFLGKASLTRQEHAQVANVMQTFLRRLEADKATIEQLQAQLAKHEGVKKAEVEVVR